MRLNLEELKKTVEYIETHTDQISVDVRFDGNRVHFNAVDKTQSGVEITLYSCDNESGQPNLLASVSKKERL
jgi:hypothetical protein